MPQVKKLSVATVYGKIDIKTIVNASAPVPLMRVFGMAVGTKTGTSAYGDWTALVGRFKAINLDTGEESEASQLFLPEVALIPLKVALAQAGNQSVTFAIDVFAKQATNTKPGGVPYEYTFENIREPSEDDPLVRLAAEIAASPKALPAPAAEPAAEAPAAAKKAARK